MDASIIIVSWNVREHLKKCLQSIKAKTKDITYEIIVVDNDSKDGSAEMVKQFFPDVTLIASPENLGFGKANNLGASKAIGKVLFILNDDIVLKENSVKIAYDKVIADEQIGVLGYHLTNEDGSHQDSVRDYPGLLDQLIILTKLHNLFPNLAPIKRYYTRNFDYSQEQDVAQVMGACMVMPKEVFDKAAGFDEQFFVWFEEVDLQKRIKDEQKLRIIYSPITEMVHFKGASFSQLMSLKSQKMFNRSMRQYFRKHLGLTKTTIIVIFQPLSLLIAWMVQLFKKYGVRIDKLKHDQS